jgi:acetylglutamate kinase
LLTDIVGVLDKDKKLIENLPTSSFGPLCNDGTITGGMIPKVENAVLAANGGCGVVSIMDGRVRHCILKALSGEVFGTRIYKN